MISKVNLMSEKTDGSLSKDATGVRYIPYEILRRSDGMIALGANLGLLGFAPSHMRLNKSMELIISSDDGVFSVGLQKIPDDASIFIQKKSHIRFYEFSSTGEIVGHDVFLKS